MVHANPFLLGRKWSTLFTAAILAFTISSCDTDDDDVTPNPTVRVVSTNLNATEEGTADPGQTVSITMEATAASGIKEITVTEVRGNSENRIQTISSGFDSRTEHSEIINYTVPTQANESIIIRMRVEDDENRASIRDFTIRILTVESTNALSMLAANGSGVTLITYTQGAFYNGLTRSVRNTAEANNEVTNIDFGFDYVNDQASLVSPDIYDASNFNASGKNATNMAPYTGSFDNATGRQIYNAAQSVGTNKQVAVQDGGNTYLVVLPGRRATLVHVNTVATNDASGRNGGMRFDVKSVNLD